MTAVLEVSQLAVSVPGDGSRTTVVDGVQLAVGQGQTLGVVGESGSGKSLSGLAVLGLLPAGVQVDGGTAIFEGRDLFKLSVGERRRLRATRIKMVFQDPMTSLNPVMRVASQLREAIRAHRRIGRKAANAEAIRLLELVGIPDPVRRARRYPHEFSGGMRQRVMLAMALATEPSLLIADEPTTALDVTVQAQVLRLVQQLQAELGTAVIWITHDLALLAGMADRVVVMYAGRVVEDADAVSIFQRPRHPYTIGLLRSAPSPKLPHRARLHAIDGAPPDPRERIEGCPFAARCEWVTQRCLSQSPALEDVESGHRVACWVRPEVHLVGGAA